MGKRLALLVLAVMVVGAFPAGAGPARVDEQEYNKVEYGVGKVSGRFGSVRFPTMKGERFISVEIVDLTGQPIAFDVYQGDNDEIDVVGCGSTTAPVKIRGGKEVTVAPILHTDTEACSPSQPTQGVIKATFTK